MNKVICGTFNKVYDQMEIGDFITNGGCCIIRCKQSPTMSNKEDIKKHFKRVGISLRDKSFVIMTHKKILESIKNSNLDKI